MPKISRRERWIVATVERIPNGKWRLANVNVATLAAGKRTSAANRAHVDSASHGRNRVDVFQEEPNLNHVAGFPVVCFKRGHGNEWLAGHFATVKDKAGRVAVAFHKRVGVHLTGWVYGLETGWVCVLIRSHERLEGFPLPALRLRVFRPENREAFLQPFNFGFRRRQRITVNLNNRLRVFQLFVRVRCHCSFGLRVGISQKSRRSRAPPLQAARKGKTKRPARPRFQGCVSWQNLRAVTIPNATIE